MTQGYKSHTNIEYSSALLSDAEKSHLQRLQREMHKRAANVA